LIKEGENNIIIHQIFLHNKDLVKRYEKFLDNCPDSFLQQTTDWANVIKDEGPDTPIFLLYEENNKDIAGIPLYLFKEDLGNILTSIPQPGPMGGIITKNDISQNKRKRIYKNLMEYIDKIAIKNNCILFCTITNPFIDDYFFYKDIFEPDFELENFTQIIDLNKPLSLSHGVRNNINKAKKLNLHVNRKIDSEIFSEWYEIHKKRHEELGVIPLEKELLHKIIFMIINTGRGDFISIHKGKKIIAGGIFIHNKYTMDVYMLSFDNSYSQFKPNYIIIDEIIEIAGKKKINFFNWQSSAKRNDGVYEFKRQWGSKEMKYYYLTKLYCSPEDIKIIGKNNIKTKYKNHFLLPFGYFESGFKQTKFSKGE
jgi:hypothetical protein